jgi:signal transduction histidine kinase
MIQAQSDQGISRDLAARSSVATFIVLQGPDKGRTIRARDEVILLGRLSDQVPLTDHTVSRRHAQIKHEADSFVLYDMNSVNGTYLNGVRLQRPTRLKHGDQIRIGSTLLVFTGAESLEQISGASIPQDLVNLDAGADAVDASIVSRVPSNEDSVVMAGPETASAVKAWRVIRQLSDVIGSLLPPDQLLNRVMDIVFEEVPVERGIILMRDQATSDLLPEIVRFIRGGMQQADEGPIITSRTVINHVVEARDGVLSSNIVSDRRFRAGKSAQNLGMRSVICAPIVAREQVLGVIYLDCPVTRHTYNEHELRLITAIGYQTGLAIENARLVQHHMQQERLAASGETVAYLSHAIKNIIHGMRSGGDLVERGISKRELPIIFQGWRIVDRNLDKVYKLMMNMLAFSKEREPNLEMVQLNKVVDEVVRDMQGQADRKSAVLLTDLEEDAPPLMLDYEGVHQLVLNLVSNAIDAVDESNGIINVSTRHEADNKVVILTVADNGPGIPEDQRERIFEPFHSTKGHGGTGLGLAVARKTVNELGGSISVRTPTEGHGAEFVVRFPTHRDTLPDPADTSGPNR